MKKYVLSISTWLLVTVATVVPAEEVTGVFGLAPAPAGAALAVWVPLDGEESITGVTWYNNDGAAAFPELLAVAGHPGVPAVLSDAVVVGRDVTGTTMGWSEWSFEVPLASATPGLYLVFRLPEGEGFVGEGAGAGLGYRIGDGQVRCWVGCGDDDWHRVSAAYQMAVTPVMNANKSGEVLVLGGDRERSAEEQGEEIAMPETASLRAAPNPFNPQTEISFVLPDRESVKLTIFDVRGRLVQTLVSGVMPAGEHSVPWDGRNRAGQSQPSGIYFALLEAGAVRLTQRLALVQ